MDVYSHPCTIKIPICLKTRGPERSVLVPRSHSVHSGAWFWTQVQVQTIVFPLAESARSKWYLSSRHVTDTLSATRGSLRDDLSISPPPKKRHLLSASYTRGSLGTAVARRCPHGSSCSSSPRPLPGDRMSDHREVGQQNGQSDAPDYFWGKGQLPYPNRHFCPLAFSRKCPPILPASPVLPQDLTSFRECLGPRTRWGSVGLCACLP